MNFINIDCNYFEPQLQSITENDSASSSQEATLEHTEQFANNFDQLEAIEDHDRINGIQSPQIL